MKNIKLKITTLTPALLLALCSCSSPPTATSTSQPAATYAPIELDREGGKVVLNAVSVTATVQSVDASTRTVVLQREDGSEMTYVCGPDVRNFNRIQVGDTVKVSATEQLAVLLLKGAVLPATGRTTVLVRSEPGAKPGGKIVDTTSITARVVAMDPVARTVTLHLPDGHERTVTVAPDVHLDQVGLGEDIGVQLTQALIITVTKP